jgi:hypothetical protein
MKRLIVLTSVFTAIVAFGTFSTPANADGFGFHFAGPGYHVDVGRPHYGHAYHGGYYNTGYGGYENYYRGGYGRSVWHDTDHYDYHPPEVVRHRNHYHVIPGHYDYHDTGHWDHYGW